MQYSHVIPIGSVCQVSDQLKHHGVEYVHSPWEWTVTPLQALIDAIEDDGQNFGIALERHDRNYTVRCLEYGHLHHHDFTRDLNDDNRVAPLTEDEIAQCRSKFLHKMGRFREACRTPGKKLFIRLGGEFREPIAWPYTGDPEPLRHSRLNQLAQTLERYCGSADLSIAQVRYGSLVQTSDDEPLDQRVAMFTLPDSVGRTSVGDFEPWVRIFKNLGLDLQAT